MNSQVLSSQNIHNDIQVPFASLTLPFLASIVLGFAINTKPLIKARGMRKWQLKTICKYIPQNHFDKNKIYN